MTMKMTAGMEKALKGFGEEMAVNVVGILADKYGFNVDEAVEHLALDGLTLKKHGAKGAKKGASKSASKGKKKATKKRDDDSASVSSRGSVKEKIEKPSVPLPFVGVVNEKFCMGIRPTHGLFSQCTNAKLSATCDYCKTCQTQVDKGATGKPACGDIRDRVETSIKILEWVDPKSGKQVLPYQNVLEKRGIELETAKAELVKFFGVEMPDEQLVKREMKRGRKAGKTVVKKEGGLLAAVHERMTNSGSGDVSDTDGMSVDDVETNVKGDMLAALAQDKPITEAKPKTAKRVPKKKPVDEEVVATPEPEAVEAPAPLTIKVPEEVEAPAQLAIEVPEVVECDDCECDSDEDGPEANFTYDGKDYYKDEDNNLFSMDGEHVGLWDEEDKVVVWAEEEED